MGDDVHSSWNRTGRMRQLIQADGQDRRGDSDREAVQELAREALARSCPARTGERVRVVREGPGGGERMDEGGPPSRALSIGGAPEARDQEPDGRDHPEDGDVESDDNSQIRPQLIVSF